MAGCFHFPKQTSAEDPTADSLVRTVNAHEVEELREFTRIFTIEEIIKALGCEEDTPSESGTPPLILDWDSDTIGVMVEVAERAFDNKKFDAMSNFLTKLLMSVGFSARGAQGYAVLAPVMARIDRLMSTMPMDEVSSVVTPVPVVETSTQVD